MGAFPDIIDSYSLSLNKNFIFLCDRFNSMVMTSPVAIRASLKLLKSIPVPQMVVLIALFSGILGSVVTLLYVNRQFIFYDTRPKRRKYESFDEEDDDGCYSSHIVQQEQELPNIS